MATAHWFSFATAMILAVACSSTPNGGTPMEKPAGTKDYASWDTLMGDEMYHVQGRFTGELTKDPDATDYQMIAATSRRNAYYFSLAHDKRSVLYMDPKDFSKERGYAQKAQAWFQDLAQAADQKDQKKLVQLMGRSKKICTQCHVDLVD